MAIVRPHAFASFAVSVLALAVALGGGVGWAVSSQTTPHSSPTCVVVKPSSFKNGWHNIGRPVGPARVCKDSQGFVHLSGGLTGGKANTVLFVLPRGYRPKLDHFFAVTGTNGGVPVVEEVYLIQGGFVFAKGDASSAVGLDGVIFTDGG